jgi:hypothetical protein
MVSTCGATEEHSRRVLKKVSQQGRSRRTGRRRTLWGTLRTCSRRERRWGAFSASCSCSCSPGVHPAPTSLEAIHKDSLSEMWNGIIWNASTKLASRTRSNSTTRVLPSLSAQAPKALPTTRVLSMDSQRSMPCAIPVWPQRVTEWNNQDAEKVCQRRSRIVQTLNVPQRVRLGPSLAAALLDSLFEHPEK